MSHLSSTTFHEVIFKTIILLKWAPGLQSDIFTAISSLVRQSSEHTRGNKQRFSNQQLCHLLQFSSLQFSFFLSLFF